MKMILLGAPGAGKGTQGAILGNLWKIPVISTGNILRAAVKSGTSNGLRAKAFMDMGELVPDDVILGIVEERLRQEDCQKGYILDGVPRTIAQAQQLERDGIQFDVVLSLEISDEEVLARMAGRRICQICGAAYHMVYAPPRQLSICDKCGGALIQREDDKVDTLRHRLQVYHRETEP